MAFIPCSRCHAKYRGKGTAVYVFIGSGPANGRYRLKFCDACAGEFLEHIDQELAQVSPDGSVAYPTVDRCMACVLPLDFTQSPVIVTAYPKGGDQAQWLGALHPECPIPSALARWLQNGLQAA